MAAYETEILSVENGRHYIQGAYVALNLLRNCEAEELDRVVEKFSLFRGRLWITGVGELERKLSYLSSSVSSSNYPLLSTLTLQAQKSVKTLDVQPPYELFRNWGK